MNKLDLVREFNMLASTGELWVDNGEGYVAVAEVTLDENDDIVVRMQEEV